VPLDPKIRRARIMGKMNARVLKDDRPKPFATKVNVMKEPKFFPIGRGDRALRFRPSALGMPGVDPRHGLVPWDRELVRLATGLG
jgi:hypothetical protein